MICSIRRLCAALCVAALLLNGALPVFADEEAESSVSETSPVEMVETTPVTTELISEDPETLPPATTEQPETEPPELTEEQTESMPAPALVEEPEETEPEETEAEESSKTREFPLYSQLDYPNKRFGSGTVATSGCGITSLAMVATYLTGHTYLPDELAGYFGGYGENNVQRLEYGAQQLKLPIRKADTIRDVFAALKEGDVAILLMNHMSIFTESQHFIVLTGLNENGKIMVADSYPPNYEKWDLKRGFVEGFEEKDLLLGYHGGWIFDVSAMPEDPFIYKEEKPYVEPRYPGVELTWEEQQLLAKLIWLEARGESRKGQQAVAEVVLNRLVSGKFGDTLSEVIYGEGQFRTTPFLKDAEAWQAQYDAIDDALSGPYVLPMNVMYFATYPENGRIWGQIGGHIFCYG